MFKEKKSGLDRLLWTAGEPVLEADLRNPITAIHLKQISDICMKHNKVVIACDYDFDNKKALVLMDRMLERNIDGLIFQALYILDWTV